VGKPTGVHERPATQPPTACQQRLPPTLALPHDAATTLQPVAGKQYIHI